ncbi:hypothetical protein GRZ59_02365 [Lactobacillus paracasei]|uniref:hypothetical protein n=1 Tax=Lacticaseibacillus paracasei TaxID=1597 RepID=UPI0013699EA7|nr:hypothetical protein [Lacticaseibacillus paracasei]MXI82610.1 hypothetical protein [Lacticaseibacillus paracasei]
MQDFFTNDLLIHANQNAVMAILANPRKLIEWDPEIQSISEDKHGHRFIILRTNSALNPREQMTISVKKNTVIYHSTEGRVAYDVIFSLITEENGTAVTEQVLLDSASVKGLPVKLLAPIAKHAFMINLTNLATFVERWALMEDGEAK